MKCQRQLLQISWQQFIRNDEVAATTDLPSISEVISNRRSALFGHVARLHQDVPSHKALHCHVDLSLGEYSVMIVSGNVVRADHERDGSIRSGRTMESPRRICGGVRRIVDIEEQRYGPRWLRVNDDEVLDCNSLLHSPSNTANSGTPLKFTVDNGRTCSCIKFHR